MPATSRTAMKTIAAESPGRSRANRPTPDRRAAARVRRRAITTPTAASALTGFASRSASSITPGPAMVAQSTVAATAAAIVTRRIRGGGADASSRSAATAVSATAAIDIGHPSSTSTREAPDQNPVPVTL